MADVAKGSVLLTPRFDGLESSINKAFSKVGGSFSAAGSKGGRAFGSGFSAKMGAAMGVAQQVVGRAMDAISSSMGAAIGRVDALNNFPRVMQNLGYSAGDAQESIDRMSAAIDGMPTSLDSITKMTQQLAPMCGGLDEATDLSIALNNAFLAGGASVDDQSRAMQQYTQMLAKGKPELEDWRTLQEVMPGQLNQIAQAMLGAGASSMDLYDALKSGKVSMGDFNDAIVRLNTEGANGFASFEEQAKSSTAGIGTAMANVQNRVSKAVSTVIEAIGPESISGAINGFSSSFQPIADKVAGFIEAAKKPCEDFIALVKDNMPSILPALSGVVAGILGLKAATGVADGITALSASLEGAAKTLKGIRVAASLVGALDGPVAGAAAGFRLLGSSIVGAMGGPVVVAIAAIAALAAAFIALWSTNEGFRNAVIGIWNQIRSAAASVWPVVQQVFAEACSAIMSIVRAAWPVVQSVISVAMGVIRVVVTTVWPVVQNAFTLACAAIRAVIAATWPLVQGVITGVMSVIQGVVSAAWPIIQAVFTAACSIISNVIDTVWHFIQATVETVMGIISGIINAVMAAIRGDWESAWSIVRDTMSSAWDSIKRGVSDGIDAVLGFFANLPGNILNALGNLGGLLFNAGASIINGLLSGIRSAFKGVQDFVGGIGDWIVSHKGPPSYDRVMLVDNGRLIMQGFLAGLDDGWGDVESYLDQRTERIARSASVYSGGIPASRSSGGLTADDIVSAIVRALRAVGAFDVTLDGRVLAGKLAPAIDRELGTRREMGYT